MESTEFLVIGAGPAGGIAAREAARAGVETVVLERDAIVGAKRVCAAGLRPGFYSEFDLPRSIVHLDTPVIALTTERQTYRFEVGPSHTTTREELDGTIASLAQASGAQIRTRVLFRGLRRERDGVVVEYADTAAGTRHEIKARNVFLAQGSSARIETTVPDMGYKNWRDGLLTCLQYRAYLEQPARPVAYETLEMHYYRSPISGEFAIAWMFPKRDHLSIGLGFGPKVEPARLRAELDAFFATVRERLFPNIAYSVREEGNLLYGGLPRPVIGRERVMIGGTAAGLVDATTGEGIYEAATSGRLAAASVVASRRAHRDPAPGYERAVKRAFYARLHQRHRLMTALERKPVRFDLLFGQFERAPKFVELLQHDRNDYTWAQWLYLYRQALVFSLAARRV